MYLCEKDHDRIMADCCAGFTTHFGGSRGPCEACGVVSDTVDCTRYKGPTPMPTAAAAPAVLLPPTHFLLDLQQFTTKGVRVICGRDRADAIAAHVNLVERLRRGDHIEVRIPADFYSITRTFWMQLFGAWIVLVGKAAFHEQVRFTGHAYLAADARDAVDDCIRVSKLGPLYRPTESG